MSLMAWSLLTGISVYFLQGIMPSSYSFAIPATAAVTSLLPPPAGPAGLARRAVNVALLLLMRKKDEMRRKDGDFHLSKVILNV